MNQPHDRKLFTLIVWQVLINSVRSVPQGTIQGRVLFETRLQVTDGQVVRAGVSVTQNVLR